jgi:hypothetical protein
MKTYLFEYCKELGNYTRIIRKREILAGREKRRDIDLFIIPNSEYTRKE